MKPSDTTELKYLDVKTKNKAIELGIEGKIKLYVVSTRFDARLFPLYAGQIQHIKSKAPNKAAIRIIDIKNVVDLYPVPPFDDLLEAQGKAVKVSIDELRIYKSDIDSSQIKSSSKKESPRSEHANLRIIGALLEVIEGIAPGIAAHPSFENETQLISFLDKAYDGFDGFSVSNLSRKFPQAKRLLSSN